MEGMREKLVTTAVIYFLFLQLAIRFGIFGPTIMDFKNILNVSQQDMSIVFSVASAGVCVGAISSGVILKYIPQQIGLAFILVILGLIVSFLAYITNYYIFLVLNFVIGVTSGAAINACEAWILEIWADGCPPYMQALQFFRGLGYIMGPILVEPFLAPEVDKSVAVTNAPTNKTFVQNLTHFNDTNDYTIQLSSNTTVSESDELVLNSNIYIPYMINGVMLVVGAIMIFFQYIYTIRNLRSTNMPSISSQATIFSVSTIEEQIKVPKTQTDEKKAKPESPKLFTIWIIFLCSIFYLFFFEEVVVTYLASFASNIALHLTKSEGAFLTSIFNLANIVGKGLSILIALKLKHFTMLYINLIIILVSLLILLFYCNTSVVMLWFGVSLLGVGLSSIVASLYALMESALQMNSMICGILNMSGTLGSVIIPLVMAQHIEQYPIILIYASLVCSITCLVILVFIHISIALRQRKFKFQHFIEDMKN